MIAKQHLTPVFGLRGTPIAFGYGDPQLGSLDAPQILPAGSTIARHLDAGRNAVTERAINRERVIR